MIELKVKVKADDYTLTDKYLVYETITLSPENPALQDYVKETLKKLKDPSDKVDVSLTIRMEW